MDRVEVAEGCAGGGVAIHSGPDQNHDGSLQDEEIAETAWVCDGVVSADGSDGSDGGDGSDGSDGADGADGADGVDGLNSLIDVLPATLDLCAAGGVVVRVGLDRDRDGLLGDDEVSAIGVVCNGVAAPPPPIRVVNEVVEVGPECLWGGVRVVSGLDRDGDGALTGVERESEVLVCQGAGAIPALPAVRISALGVEAPCAQGGVVVEAGLDLDGNGRLDDAEVISAEPVCSGLQTPDQGVLQGSIVVANSADVASLARYTSVTGDVTISGVGLTEVRLPALGQIAGQLRVSAPGLRTLDLAGLDAVGGLSLTGGALESVDLSGLSEVAGALTLESASLPCLRLPELIRIGAALKVSGAALRCFEAPRLEEVVGAASVTPPQLDQLVLSALIEVGGPLAVTQTQLAELALPALETAPAIQATGAPLRRLVAPWLGEVPGDLRIDAAGVTDFDLSGLLAVGGTVKVVVAAETWPDWSSLREVGGDLWLECGGACAEAAGDELGALERVGGHLYLRGSASERLPGLPRLREVGALTWVDHPEARSWAGAPSLERSGAWNLANLPALAQGLVLPSPLAAPTTAHLTSVGLTSVSATAPAWSGVTATGAPALSAVQLGGSAEAFNLSVTDAPLTQLHVGEGLACVQLGLTRTALAAVDWRVVSAGLDLRENAALRSVVVPDLCGALKIVDSPLLVELEVGEPEIVMGIHLSGLALEEVLLPSVTLVRGGIGISNMPALRSVDLRAAVNELWDWENQLWRRGRPAFIGNSPVLTFVDVSSADVADVRAPSVTHLRLKRSAGVEDPWAEIHRYWGRWETWYELAPGALVEALQPSKHATGTVGSSGGTGRVLPPDDLYRYRYLGSGPMSPQLVDAYDFADRPFENLVEAHAVTLISPSGRYHLDDLPALTKITGSLTVKDNPHISGCDIERFLARLEARPSALYISGNALPNACP